ncbi:MAG: hypothetical protein ICV78_15710 [Tolypothrix sp. Co-bin9]|nr:hypothetical protein [Tolypothrix sp. Co-bin9]
MRMAGCYRFNKGKEQVVEFHSECKYTVAQIKEVCKSTFPHGISDLHWREYSKLKGKAYPYQIRELFYKTEEQLTPKKIPIRRDNVDFKNTTAIPLIEFVGKETRSLIENGVVQGQEGRNPTALKIASQLRGKMLVLDRLGINYIDDAYDLVQIFCDNCNPSISYECDRIWNNSSGVGELTSIDDNWYLYKASRWLKENNLDEYRRIYKDDDNNLNEETTDYQKTKEEYFTEYEKKRKEVAKFKFTRVPNILIDNGYFPDLKLKDLPRGLIGIKGDWGTGKSHLIANLIKQYPGNRVIQIGHLNSLLFNTSQKYGLIHHHIAKDQKFGLYGCDHLAITDISVAALLRIEPYGEQRYTLVLDEIEQILNSLVNNKNLKGSLRMAYFRKIIYLIRNAEYIIFADADLSDSTLEFLEKIRNAENFEYEAESTFVIHHTKKQGRGRKIKFSKDKGATLKRLYKSLDSGYKNIVAFENKSDLLALEKLTINDEFRKSTDIIHGDNSQQEQVREYIKNIDTLYTESNNLFYTGTLGTGIDLSREHYKKRFGIFTGDVYAASDQCQQFSRYRPNCDSEIYCDTKKRTLKIDADQLVLELIDKNNESTAYFCDNISKLIEAGLYPKPDGTLDEYDQAFLKLWGIINARSNASRANPSQTLIDRLTDAGYELEFLDDSEGKTENDSTLESYKATKKEIKEQEDILVAESRILTDDEYIDAIRQKGNLDKEKQREVLKTRLHNTLGIPIDAGIVRLERTRKISKGLTLLHLLLTDDESVIAFEMRDIKNNPIITDRSHFLKKRELLKKLQIPEFLAYLNAGNSYSKNNDWVKSIAKVARANYKSMDRWLSIKIKFEKDKEGYKQTDTEIVGQILAKLGLLTTNENLRINGGNDREREYQLEPTYWGQVLTTIIPYMDSRKPKQNDYQQDPNLSDEFDPAHPERYYVPRSKQDGEKMAEILAT